MALDPRIPITQLDGRAFLALTIWAEARNQPLDGQVAVGQIIMNRLASGRWGKSIADVVLSRAQFSCWSPLYGGKTNFEALLGRCQQVLNGQITDANLIQAYWLADGLMQGWARNRIGTACHYLNPKAVKKMPRWADPRKRTASIGDHDFYTGIA